jgi:hypothetical protein
MENAPIIIRWVSNAKPGTHGYFDGLRKNGAFAGKPRQIPGSPYTVQDLEDMGFVGIFVPAEP